VRLIVWCKKCQHQVESDPAEQAQRYGAEIPVPEWRERLVCSACGSRDVGQRHRTAVSTLPRSVVFFCGEDEGER
jgi:hypothetical protein